MFSPIVLCVRSEFDFNKDAKENDVWLLYCRASAIRTILNHHGVYSFVKVS